MFVRPYPRRRLFTLWSLFIFAPTSGTAQRSRNGWTSLESVVSKPRPVISETEGITDDRPHPSDHTVLLSALCRASCHFSCHSQETWRQHHVKSPLSPTIGELRSIRFTKGKTYAPFPPSVKGDEGGFWAFAVKPSFFHRRPRSKAPRFLSYWRFPPSCFERGREKTRYSSGTSFF